MFKGGAGGLGAATLSRLCNEAQYFKGTGEEQAALFDQISREYTRVKDYLQRMEFLQ